MPTQTKYRPYFSYNLWSDYEPRFDREAFHCQMQYGFKRARKKEPIIANLLAKDLLAQKIGHLAQQGVYQFHADDKLLNRADGVQLVANLLALEQYQPEIARRVTTILELYYHQPILKGKNILQLERGDEKIPTPLVIKLQRKELNFYVAMDCIYLEPDGTVHILDFKTGKSNFDRRQAYTYLLAAKYLYPDRAIVASFYNLESQERSKYITAAPVQIQGLELHIVKIAQQLANDLERYRNNPSAFANIFPPNPGSQCQYCPVSSICEYKDHDCISTELY